MAHRIVTIPMTFKVIHLLQAFSGEISRTVMQHLTKFQTDIARRAVPLR